MADRFFADAELQTGPVELTGSEAHHLTHVLRKRVGDTVALFNGRGVESDATIAAINRQTVELEVIDVRIVPEDTGRDITLAVAVPKKDRFRWLAEKAMELGVRRLIPLKTERGVVDPRIGKLDKIRQAVIEAAKQCRAARLMEVTAVTTMSECLAANRSPLLIAHPGGKPTSDVLPQLEPAAPLTFFVGPEGGFTDEEVGDAVAAGAITIDLGRNILRVETAAIALAAHARLA